MELLQVETKMSKMEALEPEETKMYEETVELHEKIDRLTQQMEGMLGRGHLSTGERTALIKELQAQQGKLEDKLSELEGDDKKKKAKAKIEGMLQQLRDRVEGLRSAPAYRRPGVLLAEPMAKLEKIARNSLTVNYNMPLFSSATSTFHTNIHYSRLPPPFPLCLVAATGAA